MSGLHLRAASAAMALALIYACFYFAGKDGLAVASGLAILRVLFEYSRLHYDSPSLRWFFFLVCSGALLAMHFGQNNPIVILFGVSVLTFSLLYRARSQEIPVEKLYFQFLTKCFGVFYCVWLPLFVLRLLYLGEDIFWFVLFLFLVFLGDTVAYLVGARYGRHRLIEVVSPKKSIEGAVAALVSTTAVSVIVGWSMSENLLLFFILGFVTSLLAQSGDLVESLIKRASHVKDSGQIMPGHGGLMDRLDGVYWAAPFYYWFVSQVLFKASH
jgi:phosphatidate cytidylyltransferase